MTTGAAGADPAPRLVLASSSPRRRQLLHEHRYEFDVVVPDVEEKTPPHLNPREIALLNAKAKAAAVAPQHPDSVVVAVDTLVALDGRPLGKPRDLGEAFAMINALNGRAHEVFSGVWVTHRCTGQSSGFIERSVVHFRRLASPAIEAYLQRINPLDKAGAYAAQDDRGAIIDRIEGSRTNVIGLPMERLGEFLRRFAPRGGSV